MMNFDITNVLAAVLVLFFTVLGAFGMPWLLQVYGAEKLNKAVKVIGILVKAAEQMFSESGMGPQRMNWVLEKAREYGIVMDLNILRSIAESEVLKLNKLIKP